MKMITTQKEVRALFWATHPEADPKKITDYSGKGKMHKTDTRCMFVEFVDDLEKSGQISQALAQRVTL